MIGRPFVARENPPVRADGRCAVCEGPRETNRSRRYGRDEAKRDPFCSTACARAFHGTTLPPSSYARGRKLGTPNSAKGVVPTIPHDIGTQPVRYPGT